MSYASNVVRSVCAVASLSLLSTGCASSEAEQDRSAGSIVDDDTANVSMPGSSVQAETTTTAAPTTATATTTTVISHHTGSSEVLIQVGDYLGWNIDHFVFGPEIVVYGDGSGYAELYEGSKDKGPVWRTVRVQLDESIVQQVLADASAIARDADVGQLPVDASPRLLVVGDRRWSINDDELEPFASFVDTLRGIIRGAEVGEWLPSRWIQHAPGTDTCTITEHPTLEAWYDAPIYPHLETLYPLGEFPIGEFPCPYY